MAGTGAGYDLSVSTFSPDGRVFQVEYAAKAVDASPLCLAVVCKDAVVMCVEKPKSSPMLCPSTNKRIIAITPTIGMVIAGMAPDGRQLWLRAREEAVAYRNNFGIEINALVLSERMALYMHAFTLYWYVRPFGNSVLIGSLESTATEATPQFKGAIYCVDPSGCCSRYSGTALGKGRPSAKTELEKMPLVDLCAEDCVVQLLKVCMVIDEESSSDTFKKEMEVAYIRGNADGVQFELLDQTAVKEALRKAKDAVDAMDSS